MDSKPLYTGLMDAALAILNDTTATESFITQQGSEYASLPAVIPFISIYEFKNEFNPKVTRVMREHEQHLKNVQALKLLQEKENNFNKKIIAKLDLCKEALKELTFKN